MEKFKVIVTCLLLAYSISGLCLETMEQCLKSQRAEPLSDDFDAIHRKCRDRIDYAAAMDECLRTEGPKDNYDWLIAGPEFCKKKLNDEKKATEDLDDKAKELRKYALRTGDDRLLKEYLNQKGINITRKSVQALPDEPVPTPSDSSNPYDEVIREFDEECRNGLKNSCIGRNTQQKTDTFEDRSVQALVKSLTEVAGIELFYFLYRAFRRNN